MYRAFEVLLEGALDAAIAEGDIVVADRPACRLETPALPVFGDATSRIALLIARRIGRPAPDVAHTLVRHVADRRGWLDHVEAAGPGFVNFHASLAFWRTALAAHLGAEPVAVAAHGRAIVLRVDPADAAVAARVRLVADGLDRLLAAAGYDVERVVGPIDVLGGCRAASDVARVVVVHAQTHGAAARRAKDAFAEAGGQPGRLSGVAIASLVVRDRGRALASAEAAVVLERPAARFVLAGTPSGDPAVLDVDRLGSNRVDNPWVLVRYALRRIARVAAPGALDPPALEALGETDRECLREVGSHSDVVELAARRLELHALEQYARRLAAVFHRRYNRGAFDGTDPCVAHARGILAGGIGHVLDVTLGMLDASPGGE